MAASPGRRAHLARLSRLAVTDDELDISPASSPSSCRPPRGSVGGAADIPSPRTRCRSPNLPRDSCAGPSQAERVGRTDAAEGLFPASRIPGEEAWDMTSGARCRRDDRPGDQQWSGRAIAAADLRRGPARDHLTDLHRGQPVDAFLHAQPRARSPPPRRSTGAGPESLVAAGVARSGEDWSHAGGAVDGGLELLGLAAAVRRHDRRPH